MRTALNGCATAAQNHPARPQCFARADKQEVIKLSDIGWNFYSERIRFLGKRRGEAFHQFMKAVISAGGSGTRISTETNRKPKLMVEIGGQAILWPLMKIFSAHGINDFIICAGYKG